MVAIRHDEIQPAVKQLEELNNRGYSRWNVFNDWLDLMLYALQGKDEPYLEIVERYDNSRDHGERDIDLFCSAFAKLQEGMKETNADLLGDIYVKLGMTSDAFGQYFTPPNICEFFAEIQTGEGGDEPESIADPACGSGRLLIAAHRKNPDAFLVGQDKDATCVKMTALNLCLFNADGYAVLGDSLAMERRRVYATRRTALGGMVQEVDPEDVNLPPIESEGSERSEPEQAGLTRWAR